MSFIYLEVLDASFSFDGVIGAFAITSNVVLIAGGPWNWGHMGAIYDGVYGAARYTERTSCLSGTRGALHGICAGA
jgi:hypothetical protein